MSGRVRFVSARACGDGGLDPRDRYCHWFDGSTAAPTVRAVVEHAMLMLDADWTFPVILGPGGRVMDGMHRIARAMLEGKTEVRLP